MPYKTNDFDRCLLVILDGWGHGNFPDRSAIAQSKTPTMDRLYKEYPNSELVTYGKEVGLPDGQMGNSEVGHLNIGAGRIVYQDLAKINKEIEDCNLEKNPVLLEAIENARTKGKKFHILGLLSDGGVHAHINHLKALTDILSEHNLPNVYIHAFLDGRDTDPEGGAEYIKDVQNYIAQTNIEIGTVIGRYYAMDRDLRWERIKKAYDLLVKGIGEQTDNLVRTIKDNYEDGKTDEFMPALINGSSNSKLEQGDIVFFINYRTDRPRQLTQALTQEAFPEYEMVPLSLHYCTMTNYNDQYKGIHILYNKDKLEKTLGEVVSDQGITQLRIAETEKYPHVSFFFSGGREKPFKGENRIMIPSPKVATYDLQPEMSAEAVTDAAIAEIREKSPHFICLNYANTDMVGHTGILEAAITACEVVDTQLGRLLEAAKEKDYNVIVIADHGNSDIIINEDGSPNTAHTTNPVPCILLPSARNRAINNIKDGKLGDLAPTILKLMGIEVPVEMDGDLLV